MAQLPAYAVDGGRVPAAMARRVTYAVSSGANGVVTVGDLKVNQTPTPSAAVRVERGGALCKQRTTGASEYETYAIAQDSFTNVSIPASTTAARTHYIIARVDDWHFTGGTAPADPLNALYWSLVRVTTITGITQPHVVLAKIVVPANTSVVTDAMITDMREVALPRRDRMTRLVYVTQVLNLTSSSFIDFPGEGKITVDVPPWAGHAIVRADLLETLHTGSANTDGRMTLMLGNVAAYTGERRFDVVYGGNTSRQDHTVISEFKIPDSYRGTPRSLVLRARRLGGEGYLRADTYTQVAYDIEFIEKV